MKVAVVGARGNMGSRYCAILRTLGHTPIEVDVAEGNTVENVGKEYSHAIVATPTAVHHSALVDLGTYREGLDILCEKPIRMDIVPLVSDVFDVVERAGNRLYCVNQYAHLPEFTAFRFRTGFDSGYNYYRSGPDGLKWDCFQIFALANEGVTLANTSPVWTCTINGVWINIANMDMAYVRMIEDFLGPKKNVWGREIVMRTTERILAHQ